MAETSSPKAASAAAGSPSPTALGEPLTDLNATNPTVPPSVTPIAHTATQQPTATPRMTPRRSGGTGALDFTPIVTHYLFLVTFVLAGVSLKSI
jgi:hypothetical protein